MPPGTSFDGSKILYIPNNHIGQRIQGQAQVMMDDKQKRYVVTVTHVASLKMADLVAYTSQENPQPVGPILSAVDVALRQAASMQSDVVCIRNGVFSPKMQNMLSPGVHTWAGYIQVRACSAFWD